MKKRSWIKNIKTACIEVGTYKPGFDFLIETLASILEKRDAAEELYKETGGNAIVKHTNKAGASNPTVNPALALWNDLNKTALSYWRDLGLTPLGLKRIDEKALKNANQDSFTEALSKIFD